VIQAPDSFCPSSEFYFALNPEGHETHDGIEVNAEGKADKLAAADGFGNGHSRDFRLTQAHRPSTTSR
jgi:hypothetical protein